MKDKLHFSHLPAYADFLLKNKVPEFSAEQLYEMRKLQVPLMKYFEGIPDEQLIQNGMKRTEDFLRHFSENKVEEFIDSSIREWTANQIPSVSKEKILPQDITLISLMRRNVFRKLLSSYTSDLSLSLKIMSEVDIFTVELDTLCFKKLIELQHTLFEQAEALSHLGNWTWDLATKKISWSKEIFNIYGLEPVEDASTYDIKSFNHPEDQEKVDREMTDSIGSLKSHDFYFRIILKDGTLKYVHTKGQPELDENGKPGRMFGTLQDVTEQKHSEEELRKSEERYHNMIDEVQDYAIILLSKEGIIQNWNKGAEKIKGYSAEEAVGKNFRIFYVKEDQENMFPDELLGKAEKEGRVTHEGWRKRKDGTLFWGNVVITSLHDKQNNVIGFSKVTRDLTERKIAEEKIKEYAESVGLKNKKLEQANKELESFSYIASHDLQEPLRKIQAFTSRLLQKEYDTLSDWGKDVFGKIQSSANRMQRLIEALLNFSRLDKTQEPLSLTDINTLLEDVKVHLHELIESADAVIESDPLPVMEVIPIQFQQLFSNLISNAIKYGRTGVAPHIKITYGITSGKNIEHSLFPDHLKYHHICIADNGIGFDQQYAEKIFELFQRLHGKSEYEGTGIGLAICKKIVENHEGFISASGQPGQGSQFNLYFPL